MKGKDKFLNKVNEFLSLYGLIKMDEGRRRERGDIENKEYRVKTDDEIIDAVFEQMGWEDILNDNPK